MEVKISKPDSINISNWQNEAEYKEVLASYGIKVNKRREIISRLNF